MAPALIALFRNSYPKKKDMMERIDRIQMLCTLFDKNVGQENAVRFSPSSAGAAVDSVGGADSVGAEVSVGGGVDSVGFVVSVGGVLGVVVSVGAVVGTVVSSVGWVVSSTLTLATTFFTILY